MILRLLVSLLTVTIVMASLNGESYCSDAGSRGVIIDAETGATTIIDGVSGATERVDAVSGATKPEFTTWEFAEGKKLQILMNDHNAAYILSTTNSDGTPHASAILPQYENDNTIKYALAHNQTRKNLDRSGSAILTVHSVSCADGTHIGARILLKRKGDVDKDMVNTKAMRVVHMFIESVLPLVD
jgi:hypothetical protein